MPKRYPPEFRRKVLDLLKAGRSVADLVRDLQISDQTIYTWRRQELIDTGQLPGLTSGEAAELVTARRRIAELETELAVHRRATELLKEAVPPKGRYAAIATMAAEGLPVEVCARAVEVQATLAEQSQHRTAQVSDLLTAACAEANGLTVLHYDRDYDAIACQRRPTNRAGHRAADDVGRVRWLGLMMSTSDHRDMILCRKAATARPKGMPTAGLTRMLVTVPDATETVASTTQY